MAKQKRPKESLDRNMVRLVKTLNSFPGIQTIGSCGGHQNPTPAQWAEGSFYVKFDVAWDLDGLFALEFLAWLVNEVMAYRTEGRVSLLPVSAPPYLNGPGTCLHFVIEGRGGADPDELGREMKEIKRKCFCPPWGEGEEIEQEDRSDQ